MNLAEVIAHSKSPAGHEIATLKVRMPRFVLAEFNTHRAFSRNSASSRAIPFKKMRKMVVEQPFVPFGFQYSHTGMQGSEYLTGKDHDRAAERWLYARDKAVQEAEYLFELGVTKQLVNRILEPFMWHTVLVTATEWENFFALRCPQYYYEPEEKYFRSKKDWLAYYEKCFGEPCRQLSDFEWLALNKSQAEIHIAAVAEAMWDALRESTPRQLKEGEWHMPFGDNIDLSHSSLDAFKYTDRALTDEELVWLRIKVATARCARLSYETLGDNPKINHGADIGLHDDLKSNGHMSPFEHCAKAMSKAELTRHFTGDLLKSEESGHGWSGNFRGFVQYRKLIPNENIV